VRPVGTKWLGLLIFLFSSFPAFVTLNMPTIKEFHEASQSEFEKGIDEFFLATKSGSDSIEKFESERGFKEIPQELRRFLSSEYA
jgi:hypothetical protein